MRFLYSLVLYLGVPFVLMHLWWRGRREPAYRRRWAERFGFIPVLPDGHVRVWIHAVSVGEVQASVPLIRRLQTERPGVRLLLTTTTPSGSTHARKLLGEDIEQLYFPYDLPDTTRRFLHRARPALALFMETELWPNIIRQCRSRGIPLVLANARVSDRAVIGYRRVAPLARDMLSDISVVAAQSERDVRRLVALGLPPERARVIGNLKFDQTLPDALGEQALALRQQWGDMRPVWMAASTHPGEDELVLKAQRTVLGTHPNALLVLVPRHPERCSRVVLDVARTGLCACLFSEPDELDESTQVLVGDEMGKLIEHYAASDVAFVGGSLVPHGGHNMLEPAALGLPVLTGPHFFNFSDIGETLIARGAARQVADAESLASELLSLLHNKDARVQMGVRGKQVVKEQRGAVERLMGVINGYVGREGVRREA